MYLGCAEERSDALWGSVFAMIVYDQANHEDAHTAMLQNVRTQWTMMQNIPRRLGRKSRRAGETRIDFDDDVVTRVWIECKLHVAFT